jgi:hypothetical protein
MMETLNLSRVEALWADAIVLAHDIKLGQLPLSFFIVSWKLAKLI